MPTRVDGVKLLVMTNPRGVLFSPHPHICPGDNPAAEAATLGASEVAWNRKRRPFSMAGEKIQKSL